MLHRVRLSSRFAMGMIGLALSGCGDSPAVSDPSACFPVDARAWLSRDTAPSGKTDPVVRPAAAATIYVDRSGSMGGYIAGATGTERPLQDLISVLPAMLERSGTKSGYAAFGTRIAPQPTSARNTLILRDFYTCKTPENCDNQESRFDLVFEDIRRKPADMALVVSDLWFVNSQVQTSALTDLAGPVGAILADGRAIAVYGIPARFAGQIYDLPNESGPLPFEGRHPLFLIAVGTDAQIDQLHESLKRSPSPYLANGVADGTIKRTVFTLNPRTASVPAPEPLTGNDPAITRTPVIGSLPGVRIQQLEIAKGTALRTPPGAKGMSWTGPSPTAFRPDTVWAGEMEGRTRVWERRGDKCTPADWIEGRSIPGLWRPATPGELRFTLDPRAIATGLARPGTYLVTGEVHRTSLLTPGPASAWMREWSFSPQQNPLGRSAGGSAFFPTLHLSEVARLMENALADASRRKPGPIAGFGTVIRMRD